MSNQIQLPKPKENMEWRTTKFS